MTGASGHAFAGHYRDQFERWAAGRTYPWLFGDDEVRAAGEDVLRLQPAGERTTGQGGYLTTPPRSGGSQLRAQCRMFAGFPLRPRHYTAGTLVAARELRFGVATCQAQPLKLGAPFTFQAGRNQPLKRN